MDLFQKCQTVLENNRRGNFTIPSPFLYPFQWNWDSGLIAIGLLHFEPENALVELETLFSGQWENGFLPHIIFHNAEKYTTYFPSADYWHSNVSDFAPKRLKTSGITQPAVHGFVLEYILEHDFGKERIARLYDQIVHYHQYLYEYRQHKNTGLVAIWHNWESGMDNSPWWDRALKSISPDLLTDINLRRKDVHEVDDSAHTRPTDDDYKRYIYLVNQLRACNYERVPADFPFQILDPVFNAILVQSNKSLCRIGEKIGKDTSQIESWIKRATDHFSEIHWDENDALFYPYDILENRQIKIHCAGSYIPIFAEIPDNAQMEKLLSHLHSFEDLHLVPSCLPGEAGFEPKNYWRGPIWVHMNWMIWNGLLKYEQYDLAEEIRLGTISLVEQFGSREYFEPFKNTTTTTGYGGKSFSWSSALVIDMLQRNSSAK